MAPFSPQIVIKIFNLIVIFYKSIFTVHNKYHLDV